MVQARRVTMFFLVIAGSVAHQAEADTIVYGSRVAFDAAVGGQTLIDFEAQNPDGPYGAVYFGANLTIGSVSFTQANALLSVFGKDWHQTSGLNSSYLNHAEFGTAPVIINFGGGGIHSVGMDIGQLYPWLGTIGNLTLALSNGANIYVSGLQQLGDSSNTTQFVGFSSTDAITQITIHDPSKGTVIDNFAYSTQAAAVPTPSSLAALVGMGTVGMIGVARRRRKRA